MPQISQQTIERILEDTDIVELVGSYIPLKRAGSNFVANCPFHNENTPSFNVNPSRQSFHCFGCKAGGDAFRFVMMYENLRFPEAVRKLADRAGITIQEEEYDPKEEARRKSRGDVKRLQKAAAEFFHYLLFKKPCAQAARDYLKDRGVSMDAARNWLLGYAPEDQRLFFDWARGEGFSWKQLVEGGLAKWRNEKYPDQGAFAFFRHRLMFPVNNEMGETIAFSGRVLSPDQRGGKYINSPETSIFDKSKTFYGLDRSKRPILQAKKAIIFEGQLDLITAFDEGLENIVAPLGTAFTEHHARVLKRQTEEVILCYDSDTAGMKAAGKSFRLLAPAGFLVRLVLLPEGEDPDSFIRKYGIDAFREKIDSAQEFFDYQIDHRGREVFQGPLRDRLEYAREIAADIALVKDKMLQDSLINRITARLGVGEQDVRRLVMAAAFSQDRAEKTRTRRENAARRRNGSEEEKSTAEDLVGIPSRSIRLLSKALLTCAETREKIASRPVPTFLQDVSGTTLLTKIWQADIKPENPASVNAFISTLPPDEQVSVSLVMIEESPAPNPDLAVDYILSIKRQSFRNRIRETEARLGAQNLQTDDVSALTKLLLDLRNQLNDIPRPG